jgi:signal transduction histidine kinase
LKIVRVLASALCVIACSVMTVAWMNTWSAYRNAGYDAAGVFSDLILGSSVYEDSRGFRLKQLEYIQNLLWILRPESGPSVTETIIFASGTKDAGTASASEAPRLSLTADPAQNPLEAVTEEDRRALTEALSIANDQLRALSTEYDYASEAQRPALEKERRLLEEKHDILRQAEQRILEAEQREAARKALERTEGLSFYVSDGTGTLSGGDVNAAAGAGAFKREAAWLVYEDGELSASPKIPERYAGIGRDIEAAPAYYEGPSRITLYLSFDENYLAERSLVLQGAQNRVLPWLWTFVAGFACALALFIYLLATTGRRDESGRVRLCALDRVFTELQLGVALAAILIGARVLISLTYVYAYYWIGGFAIGRDSVADTILASGSSACLAVVGLWTLLSLARNLKAHSFFKNALLYRLGRLLSRFFKALFGRVRAIFDRKNPMTKTVLLALAICALSATIVLAPVVFALILVFGSHWVKKYAAIKRGVEEVKNGNLSWQIPADADARGEFDELARGINEISEASNRAIQNELKNQRLKTDLISNVSHDLKTPLTSIITYVDLLKREGLDNPSAADYLAVLDQKSQRLKRLTEDLFEAAKASSGTIPVHPERIDLLSLIRQGLGEMDEALSARRLDVKLRFENEKYCVRADGQLLWRIVENLLGNVQKYALEGSRVYIDLSETQTQSGGMTVLEIKNMSEAQLNISAEELTERFVRGDESRAEDGSGLGLAIAKDLARLQNGRFEITIDGDLFKTVLMLEKWKEEAA